MKLNFLAPSPTVIGMIHLAALPGTPHSHLMPAQILAQALQEADIYQKAGVHTILIENMHDIPYLKREVGPEISSLMTLIGYEIKQKTGMAVGIQILAGANEAALAAAYAADLDFIRAEGFVFGHVADEGWLDGDAGSLLRYRKKIGAASIPILTDIKKKHSAHALTADVDIVETAKAAAFFASDGLILTGIATGASADISELAAVQKAVSLPLLVGSGITIDNIEHYLPYCDGLIVGSWFKEEGNWKNPPDPDRVRSLMEKVRNWRQALQN